MKYIDIKQFPNINYKCVVEWNALEDVLVRYIERYNLQLNPDFQRGHVWTDEQQTKYVEFMLRNPSSGREIFLNHPGWMTSWKGDFVLVDGLQRITAARRFMNNEIPAFGFFYNEYEPYYVNDGRISSDVSFNFNIGKVKTREDVLKWYLDFNSAGTIHSKEELERVKGLLMVEKSRR